MIWSGLANSIQFKIPDNLILAAAKRPIFALTKLQVDWFLKSVRRSISSTNVFWCLNSKDFKKTSKTATCFENQYTTPVFSWCFPTLHENNYVWKHQKNKKVLLEICRATTQNATNRLFVYRPDLTLSDQFQHHTIAEYRYLYGVRDLVHCKACRTNKITEHQGCVL